MRKALILTVLALFGSETLAQNSFRRVPTVAQDDAQDNQMFFANRDSRFQIGTVYNPSNPVKNLGMRFDDSQDNEMALDLSQATINRAITDTLREMRNDYRVKVGRWDDVEDNTLFSMSDLSRGGRMVYNGQTGRCNDDAQDDELFTQADLGRMSSPFLSGSGLVGGGGSARGGGVAMGGTGQLNLNIGKNTQLITGLSASHAPGSRVNLAPHVGVNFKFDDQDDELFAEDDEFFAEDDELFTQGDLGRMSGFLGNGGSGIAAGGGSARGGGVAWGGAAQYAHNIGKNTQLIGGASFSHAPGSRVGINPHVGMKFSFDDAAEDN